MRVVPALIVMALLIAAAVFIADRPGSVAIAWQGWRIDTSVAVLVLGTALFAVIAATIYTALRRLVGAPRAYLRARREQRRQRGYRALTQGMVAVAAGDAAEAQKLARKADALLAEPPLTLLLSAQAAQLDGDEQAAERYFTAMLDRAETEFLGLRGLIMQAQRGGDATRALQLTERAKILRPRTPWVLSSLFELQARAGQWTAAEGSLVEAARRKALPAPAARHRRAVLLLEAARSAEAEGRPTDAIRLAAKAQALEAGFAPVALSYARMLALRGQTRQARKVIDTAWRAEPHPELAEEYGALFAEETPVERLKRVERLTAAHADHLESHLALARAALTARLWGEARRHLVAARAPWAEAGDPPPRLCRLMAEIEEGEQGDHLAARGWLARATTTASADPAYVCQSCNAETPSWTALCPRCHGFDTLAWRAAATAAAPRLAPLASPPPLPVLASAAGGELG